ncbi:hypothetical protein RhiirA5_364264 [Rhizophagus irregularis]|uniref:Uncharacterized protein n=4 Tax=Rhizophagus irregularis TaxID=588596 RepID=U9UFT0_RHIID|nr:hypothetical protein GLOIN_2v1669900 [Rhizophagus irregularis DAOM 181602=DAOM 197198]EXX53982.1 hypothetical protein RirG_238820 [Rhizophagus irregularis DAOM 197198w]PKC02290.1 hypothetical protein RhiirA5_364264 [Rhizophagus irregularis]POG65059.1 hypothetical protein GLOIN_2v1669900 [Rhizophagus irregularis DAOM 181602=DAOM 197198]UZO25585.1 hypothetical protein OCT59_017850 [Rhizophagus irregularis]CAG8644156.1 9785_t:CDS:1 [Rhizophagus irregularis]|eukprot:XP_025171925.1 hypothetical protein GLOIN_2v1669900 [Rhizophagus irregularis DAOM 181602=DAOM 197198]
MKFASVLIIFLVFVVAIASANPILERRKLGNNVVTTGVKFKDLYESLNNKVKKVEKAYGEAIPSFHKEIKEAAEKDGTDVPEFLEKWNKKYKSLSVQYIAISNAMGKSIDKLGKYIKENS